jgi:AraC-like DNA-binding protein
MLTLKAKDWFTNAFPLSVERRDPQPEFPPHKHEFSEVVFVTNGSGLHVTGKESWRLSAGDVFVIGGSRVHEYRELRNLGLINILFDPAKLRLQLADLPAVPGYHALFTLEPVWRTRHKFQSRLRLSPSELVTVLGFVDQLEVELKQRTAGFGFQATALFMQIVCYLSRCYSRFRSPDSRAMLRNAEAIAHLEANFAAPLNLDHLAGIAHMSKRSFIRSFQAATGNSPIAYLIELRVRHAARLLRQTGQSITEIAFEVGFNDSNYFTRQFRAVTGLTPRSYRLQQQRGL